MLSFPALHLTPSLLLDAGVGVSPALVLLGAMLLFDSYKLVNFSEVLMTLIIGGLLACAAYFANGALSDSLPMSFRQYAHEVAPLVEESLKAAGVLYLFARNRIGFLIDAATLGFALGAGFAVVENVYLLLIFQHGSLGLWALRGFGTAIMHAGATALFALMVQALIERRLAPSALFALAAFLAPVALHAGFNWLEAAPLVSTVLLLIILPPSFLAVFTKSEHGVHDWLVQDYESHLHLLEDIKAGRFEHSAAGRFINRLSDRFPKATAALIFEYVQLHTELVTRAESIALAREKGESLKGTKDDHARFRRLHALERKIGRTAMLVLWPHLHFSRRELWELHEFELSLGKAAGR